MQQFADATAHRDTHTLCTQVLAPNLIAHLTQAGVSCRQAMTVFVSSVHNPTLSVSKITVRGSSASAVVLAGATGQPATLETIELTRMRSGWRLASLTSPH